MKHIIPEKKTGSPEYQLSDSEHIEGTAQGQPPRMELAVDEEGMEAHLRLKSPRRPEINHGAVMDLLNDYGIIFGIDSMAIRRALDAYENIEPGRIIDEVVARGNTPIKGQDGQVEILVKEAEQVTIDESGRADFRNVERFRTVEKGQTIARIIPEVPGKPGTNVYGQEVSPEKVHKPLLKAGNNVEILPGTNDYVSQVRGVFNYRKDTVEVNPVLLISGSVGLESGNVHYDGSVQVGQNIDRGSSVQVHGNLIVGGAVESGDIKVGGSLTVKKGINSRKEGTIRVGGELNAIYVDNSKITVESDVHIEKSLISSNIITHGNLSVSGHGSTISGGELFVFGSVSADVIGNRNESPTKIIIGEHFQNKMYFELHSKELDEVEKKHEKITEKIHKIKVYVQRTRGNIPADKKAEFRVIFQEYKEIVDKKKRLEDLVQHFKANRFNKGAVTIVAREIIHPGVEIHYRTRVEKFKAPMTACVITFKPGMEKPSIEAFKRA